MTMYLANIRLSIALFVGINTRRNNDRDKSDIILKERNERI